MYIYHSGAVDVPPPIPSAIHVHYADKRLVMNPMETKKAQHAL